METGMIQFRSFYHAFLWAFCAQGPCCVKIHGFKIVIDTLNPQNCEVIE